MSVIGVDRLLFHSYRSADDQVSIDTQLQNHLQMIVDSGVTIVSVQQTECIRAQPGALDTYIRWAEFLIITSHKDLNA